MKLFKNNKNNKGRKIFITLIIIGFITLTITMGQKYKFTAIGNGMQYIVVPIKKGINTIGNSLGNVTLRFKNISKLEKENNELKEKVDELTYNDSILQEHEKENKRLKKLLDAKERHIKYPSNGANVISKEPGNWYKIFIIDKGYKKSVNNNDVILADGGLVGHIIESGPLSSKVLSIIDDRSSVSAKVQRTGDIGILKGDIELIQEGLCRLQVDIQSEIIKGDQIVTSHLSDIYPSGITIGIVEDIIIAQNGLNQYAHIRPVVDFKHLEQVLTLNTSNETNDIKETKK